MTEEDEERYTSFVWLLPKTNEQIERDKRQIEAYLSLMLEIEKEKQQ